MSLTNLDNLAKSNNIKIEPYDEKEFLGLLKSGKNRLKDANTKSLELESRFLLAYNAAHSLALAALRWHGYRPDNRYIVFQVLTHTADIEQHMVRVFAKCHDLRNTAEYEGSLEIDEQLFNDLLTATQSLLQRVENLNK